MLYFLEQRIRFYNFLFNYVLFTKSFSFLRKKYFWFIFLFIGVFSISNAQVSNVLFIEIEDGRYSSNTAIRFKEGATLEFDRYFDAYYLKGQYPVNIYNKNYQNIDFSIQSIPLNTQRQVIPLGLIHPDVKKSYSLRFSEQLIDDDIDLVLVDLYLDVIKTIKHDVVYKFDYTEDIASHGQFRFVIVKKESLITNVFDDDAMEDKLILYPNPVSTSEGINIRGKRLNELHRINVYSTKGDIVFSKRVFEFQDDEYLITPELEAGTYYVELIGLSQEKISLVIF